MTIDMDFVYTGEDLKSNWFYEKYYVPYGGSNYRYFTFQTALNLIHQKVKNPVIVETGCQRQEEDVGGGMSTSIFAEYIHRYGGRLISVDNVREHLERARSYVQKWQGVDAQFVESDSVAFLQRYDGPCDLLYLDSFDFPIFELREMYNAQTETQRLSSLGREEIIRRHRDLITPCQLHCLNEFRAIEDRLSRHCVLLVDDNSLSGGGKPGMLKPYLASKGWVCLMDLQQTLFVREV